MCVDWAPEGLAEFLCLASHSQGFGLQNELAQNFLPGIAVAGEYQNKSFLKIFFLFLIAEEQPYLIKAI